jgi:hypothetical protein
VTTSRSKAKGTAGEREVRQAFAEWLGDGWLRRTAPSCAWDLEHVDPDPTIGRFDVLATRPDRGRWLATVSLRTLAYLLAVLEEHGERFELRVEVKRYRRFALHTIYEETFDA